VECKRKTARLSLNEIPEILQKPILLFNYEEVESKIENLSSVGIGLVVAKSAGIVKGDIFYLKYHDLESDIKCVCVCNDEDDNGISIGAYFTEPDDILVIAKHLYNQMDN
jgi:hypothetical protein